MQFGSGPGIEPNVRISRIFKNHLHCRTCALKKTYPQISPHVTPQVARPLQALVGEMSREGLQNALDSQDRKSLWETYLKPALAEELIEVPIPDKPNSRLQKHRLTERGSN